MVKQGQEFPGKPPCTLYGRGVHPTMEPALACPSRRLRNSPGVSEKRCRVRSRLAAGFHGEWIVFSSDRSGDFDLYIMRPDGSDLGRITTAVGKDSDPAWGP
jgi:hypothetical protein